MVAADDPLTTSPARAQGARLVRVVDVVLVGSAVITGWAGLAAARANPDIEAAPLTVATGVCAVLAALPLWWRRQCPLGVLGAVAAALALVAAVDDRGLFGGQVVLVVAIACFAVGAWTTRQRTAAAVLAGLMVLVMVAAAGNDASVPAAGAYAVALIALPAVVGYATRTRRQYVAEVERRLAAAERDRDERARRAVQDERARIARELHDVVAHHVSLIGVQAGAARTALDRSPQLTRTALAGIEAASRAAVAEMRQLLEVLAPHGETDEVDGRRDPQPGLDRLDSLAGAWRAAGVPVALTVIGAVATLPPTLSLCGYRIVEEALTNVARHSAVRAATVRVELSPKAVQLEVRNSGPGRAEPTSGSGRGIVGMRERVELFGGSLVTMTLPDGGYVVQATLPWSAP